jgi:hypothetical protein
MFTYEVFTEEQAMAERFQLLPDGIYEAVTTASFDKKSSSGNPMMEVHLSVWDKEGRTYEIKDFLVFTKGMMWKVIHFAHSAGLLKEYEEGKLCSDVVISEIVKVKVSIEPGKEIPQDKLNGKPVGSKYFDKNRIEDYLPREDKIDIPFNDDISF